MDLSLTEDQKLLQNSTREFVREVLPKDVLLELDDVDVGYTDEIWRKVSNLGWMGMLIPEEYGGSGNSFTDAAVVFEELGRGPVPGPYFSSGVLSALMILEAGTSEQKQSLLPQIASGQQTIAAAITEPDYGWGPESIHMTASKANGTYTLTGTKLFVQDAGAATQLICPIRTSENSQNAGEGISLALVSSTAPGVTRRSLPGFITGTSEVTFNSVEVPEADILGATPGNGWAAVEKAIHGAIPILCAYQVGGCQAVFDLSVEYSRTRKQFGTPIGRFQRVQDHIIVIANNLDASRWTTFEALWKLDTNRPAAGSIHMAKAVSSEGYLKACDFAHEVHAGVGVMREYGLTLHTKMSRTLYHLLGDPKFHKQRLAVALEL